MNLDHLSSRARAALQDARTIARRHRQEQIEVEHLLLALMLQDDGLVTPVLKRAGVDINYVSRRIENDVKRQPKSFNATDAWPSPRLDAVLQGAVREARRQNRDYAETGDVLVAIAQAPTGPAPVMLRGMNVDRDAIMRLLPEVARGQREGRGAPAGAPPSGPNGGSRPANTSAGESSGQPSAEPLWRAKPGAYPNLEKFGRDITQLAATGQLDPVIGRDAEIRRIMQVLARRTKNNPVLVGEPGVGKTAIVEALAQRIVKGDVPDSLKNKMLVSLDLGALISGARLRGMFEERLKGVIQEVVDARGEILMYIDEIHSLVGAGAGDGGVDASSMLKPPLARGQLRTIGTTTIKEYRRIEKDRALARRFEPISVEEPSVDQAIAILRGIRSKYELHHGVEIRDEALVAACKLSDRYVTDRLLPDKAIDLIDEAASRLRIEIESQPHEIDILKRRLTGLEMEQQAVARETDKDSNERRAALSSEAETRRGQIDKLEGRWRIEKDALVEIRALKEVMEKTHAEIAAANEAGDKARAAELRFDKLKMLERELDAQHKKLAEATGGEGRLLDEHVDADHIADVVAQWTGIPVSKMLESEREKLLKIEERLGDRVIGQSEAVAAVARAVRRARAGLQDPNRPIGSFIFLGPTGVGKTELAKALAQFLFDDENAMVRMDMSEFMEKHQVARLIGPPPGYQGHEEGGQLTEAVRLRPYSVVLFDEVEKAHADVFNTMLQLLDDGRLTDGKGRTVDFTNTVVIMTSNLGSHAILELVRTDPTRMREEVFEALEKHFRPEFLARIDAKVIFNSLTREDITKILELQLRRVRKLLADRKLTLELTDAARAFVVDEGYDPAFGARPVKQAILEHIQDPLAMELLEGDFAEGDTIRADHEDGADHLTFHRIAKGGSKPVEPPADKMPPPPGRPEPPEAPATPFETIGGPD